VSKHDTHFMNVVSIVLGLLVAITVVLFALARIIGNRTQVVQVQSDPAYVAQVRENIQPFARVAVAGQDNSVLTIDAPVAMTKATTATAEAPAAAAAPAATLDGAAVYASTCKVCHEAGLAGAPKSGDKAVWAPRIAQGKATLYEHAIKGFTGKTGVMLPKGGRTDLSDDLIKQSVDHMVALAQ
jgi:cytochrome c5